MWDALWGVLGPICNNFSGVALCLCIVSLCICFEIGFEEKICKNYWKTGMQVNCRFFCPSPHISYMKTAIWLSLMTIGLGINSLIFKTVMSIITSEGLFWAINNFLPFLSKHLNGNSDRGFSNLFAFSPIPSPCHVQVAKEPLSTVQRMRLNIMLQLSHAHEP